MVLLLCLTAAAFSGVLTAGFVDFDDDQIVTENANLTLGLSLRGFQWAFTNTTFGKWTPIAWLTHLFDVQFFGLDPRGHHLTNLLLHLGNVGLLFAMMSVVTGSVWRSWLVAVLFALHPLHVEPVAWVATRRDLVSTPFWIATMYSHWLYAVSRKRRWYLISLACLTMGLMGKSMLMSLPLVLLLMDYWPLGRAIPLRMAGNKEIAPRAGLSLWALMWEKVPHAAIAAAVALIAGWNEYQLGAVKSLEDFPLASRAGNAVVSYVRYLGKTVYPLDLAVWYPHPRGGLSLWLVVACALFLVLVSVMVISSDRRRPWLITGWFWYLGTLVPVIGIVQLGGFSMADRFVYMPLTGVFIILAWTFPDLSQLARGTRMIFCAAAATAILMLLAMTRIQVGYWQNGITLFEHTLAVTKDNYLGSYTLGNYYKKKGDVAEAIQHYREALRISPAFSEAHNNLGALLLLSGRSEEAVEHLVLAVRHGGNNVEAQYNLGMAYVQSGRPDLAFPHLKEVASRSPADPRFREMVDLARDWVGRFSE